MRPEYRAQQQRQRIYSFVKMVLVVIIVGTLAGFAISRKDQLVKYFKPWFESEQETAAPAVAPHVAERPAEPAGVQPSVPAPEAQSALPAPKAAPPPPAPER